MTSSRRSFLKKIAAAAALSVSGPRLFGPLLRAQPRALGNTLRILADLDGTVLTGAPVMAELQPGVQTAVYGLNGSYLGPTIRLNSGDRFSVQLQNRLVDEDLILHWHGLFAPEDMDGHPRHAVGPGENYDYDFLVNQRAGTYWYHSHTDMITAPQVYKGLAGLFIVHDDEEQGLGLPAGEYDVPLVVQDKRVTPEFQLEYAPTQVDVMRGWQGDTILVNGTPDATFSAAQTLYRFRLLNGANARVWKIGFSDNRRFHLIASDGGLLEQPIEIDSFFLPPGARAEILVDFSADQLNSEVLLQSLSFEGESIVGTRQGKPADLMRICVEREASSGGMVPETLSSIEHLDPLAAIRTRDFRTHMVDGQHAINDLVFSMNRVDFDVPMNELEIWEFFNPSQSIHPMHVHGVHFQVVERNGMAENVWPEERGWKDTVLLFPFDRVRVALRFDAHPGIFMLHCHNLEHEDDGMMMNFRVTPPSSVAEQNTTFRHLQAHPNPVSSQTTVRFKAESRSRTLTLVDQRGNLVLQHNVPAHVEHVSLDLSHVAAGSYWCKIGTEALRLTRV